MAPASIGMTTPCLPQWSVFGNDRDLQTPFDVAVVMPTVGRKEIVKAIDSVFAQRLAGRIQLLVGVDRPSGDLADLTEALARAPDNVTPCLFYPGYSTSVRHGGLHPARDGGVLRCTLTHLANAEMVAYLDDDNWWGETHLADLLAAVQGRHWAFSLRWFVHPETGRSICVDEWESVGPDRGIFREKMGGFVDPNCLMLNKLRCWRAVALWNHPLKGDKKGMSADRNVFNFLKSREAGRTGVASAFYVVDPKDGLHPHRLRRMGARYSAAGDDKI